MVNQVFLLLITNGACVSSILIALLPEFELNA